MFTRPISFSTLGLRASMPLSFGSMEATLRGMAGWRHAYGDVTPMSRLAFTGMDTFEISGLPIARDAALLGVGSMSLLHRPPRSASPIRGRSPAKCKITAYGPI